MAPSCQYCKKTYKSGAALNFHLRKAHQNQQAEQNLEPIQRSTCRMIKFGKLQGLPDPFSGPFRLFNDPKPKSRAIVKKTEGKRVTAKSAKCKPVPVVLDDDDDDITIIEIKTDPKPSTSKQVIKVETPNSPEPKRKKAKHNSRSGGVKRSRLSADFTATSDDSSASDGGEGYRPPDQPTEPIPSTSFSGKQNNVPNNSSFSGTEEDDNQLISTPGTSGAHTSSLPSSLPQTPRRGRQPKNSDASSSPKSCPVCGKSGFRNPRLFTIHYEIHQGLRPFPCPFPDCGMAYATDLQLLEHVSIKHSGQPSFECDLCGNSYKRQIMLKKHKCSGAK